MKSLVTKVNDVCCNENVSKPIIDSLSDNEYFDFFSFEYEIFKKAYNFKKTHIISLNNVLSEDITKYKQKLIKFQEKINNIQFDILIEYNKQIIGMYPELFYLTVPCYVMYYGMFTNKNNFSDSEKRTEKLVKLFKENFDDTKLKLLLDQYAYKRILEFERRIVLEKRKMAKPVSEVTDNINHNLKDFGYIDFEVHLKKDTDYITSEQAMPIFPVFELFRIKYSSGQRDFISEEDFQNLSESEITAKYEKDNVFKSLSEGEKHFLAFLYFFYFCKGYDDFDNCFSLKSGKYEVAPKKKVIIFDDPVTSMDSNVLFIVSSFLCDLFKGKNKNADFENETISQGFVLTHNSYFFREFDYRKKTCVSCNNYLVKKLIKDNKYKTFIEKGFSLKDDYSLMWKTLKDLKDARDDSKSMNIVVGNLCRRILESYGKFMAIDNTDSLANIIQELENQGVSFGQKEKELFKSFIAMINTESHYVSPYEDSYYSTLSSMDKDDIYDILSKLFKKMNGKLDKSQYEKRMK